MTVTKTIIFFCEKKEEFDKLIVMDDVSSLVDKSSGCSGFLTFSRKFDYSCLYVCHILYPNKPNCQILSPKP